MLSFGHLYIQFISSWILFFSSVKKIELKRIFRYEKQINDFVRELLHSYEFPSNECKLTDLYPSMDSSSNPCFIDIHHWLKSHQIHYDCIDQYQSSMRLMSMLISNHCPLGIFTYQSGLGKTTLIKQFLGNFYYIRYVSDGSNRTLMRKEVLENNSSILSHRKSNRQLKFVLWFEDLLSEDSELVRSWISEKESDLNYLLTGKDFYSYSKRLTRHFVPIILHESLPNLIEAIYSIQIKNWLEEFSVEDIHHPIELAHACSCTLEEIFQFLIRFLNQYHWNLHHVEQIVMGLVLFNPKFKRTHLNLQKQSNLFSRKKSHDDQVFNVVALLAHEISRIVLDRLNEPKGLLDLSPAPFQSIGFFLSFRSNFISRLFLQNFREQFLYGIRISFCFYR